MSMTTSKIKQPQITQCNAHIALCWLVLSCYQCSPAIGHSDINTSKCLDTERKALLQFKSGIPDDVYSCGLLTSWKDDTDCCQWHGVHCSNDTGHVIKLRLQGSDIHHPCLQGNLSSSLVELKYLRHLKLDFHDFSLSSLNFLGSLANLEYLSLRYVFHTGAFIPSNFFYFSKTSDPNSSYSPHAETLHWLSPLKMLRYLDLSGSNLSEAETWLQIISSFPFLRVLRMDDCQLPVNTPSSLAFNNSSPHLRKLTLSDNGIISNSYIFQWLFSLPHNTSQLEYLDLSSNSLAGPIPNRFGSLRHLSHLDLSDNHLEGSIPIEISSLHYLSYLSLSYNNIQGSVFKIFTGLCNLQQLYLRANNISDELTNVIQALLCADTKLMTLDLSQNHFSGAIPDSIGSFSLLRELYLDENQLNGNISAGMGQLSKLEKLNISSNSLKATLTHTHFLSLSRLRELYLSDNTRIVMNIDASWDPPFQLDLISLRSCKLGPYFPNWLKMQTNFTYLDISNAEISDTVPVSFWNLSSDLVYMNMSYNQFYGPIPNLSQTFNLIFRVVDLSSNLFEGAIPSWFTKFFHLFLNDNRFSDFSNIFCPKTTSYLGIIDLSNNLLSGELPDCWTNFDELSSLHLENNRISGILPKSIGNLVNLRFLHLHNNSFSGVVPASLKNSFNLIVLNLGYNSFTGNIPPWISNFQSLGALILRSNNFHGKVTASLCQLPNLQILDFAMNHISGVIPKCIGNLMAMTGNNGSLYLGSDDDSFDGNPSFDGSEPISITWKREEQKYKSTVRFVKSIDFSKNNLNGEIPDGIFNLTGLLSLDLSKNNLSGNISAEIGQLAALELLDLSDNRLKGAIPASLSSLSSLAILDLSNNILSGKIPLGTQLQSFNSSSYAGNPGLCGAPLSTCPGDQTPVNTFEGGNTSAVPHEHHDNNGVFPGLCISVALGLIIGFWGVFGTLIMKNSWRYAWFRLLDSIQDRLYVIAMGVVAKVWKKP